MKKKIEKKNFPRNVKDIITMTNKKVLKYDNVVQRNFCWTNTAKDNKMSLLIDTILRGFPIPPVYCCCEINKDGIREYSCLDGIQRLTTVNKFYNNEFKLVGLDTFEDEDGNEIDINGMTYSELPEDMKDDFRSYSFTFNYFEDVDEDTVFELFNRMNNGKALSSISKTRASARSFYTIKDLASHPIFEEMLTPASIASYGNEDIVIKSWIMLNKEKPCLDTKEVRPIMKDAEITTEQAEQIKNIFDRIREVHNVIVNNETIEDKLKNKIAKRIYTKTHFVSIVPLIAKAIKDDRMNSEIASMLIKFFSGGKNATISESYNLATGSGSGHSESVKSRQNALFTEYDNYFSEDVAEPVEEESWEEVEMETEE